MGLETTTGPAMPRHTQWVEVQGYPGFEVQVWTNAKQATYQGLGSGDIARYREAMTTLLLDVRTVTPDQTYDQWFDHDGDPLPPVGDPEFFAVIPDELLICVGRTIFQSPSLLPNSLAPMKRR